MRMRENRVFIWCLLMALVFVALIVLLSGCGLHLVRPGETPPPGSKPISEVILDAATQADQAGWGGLAKIIGGALGCGGIVAVARKALRDRTKRKEAKRNRTALQEVIAGIEDVREVDTDDNEFKEMLNRHQCSETRQIVRDLKTAMKADEER